MIIMAVPDYTRSVLRPRSSRTLATVLTFTSSPRSRGMIPGSGTMTCSVSKVSLKVSAIMSSIKRAASRADGTYTSINQHGQQLLKSLITSHAVRRIKTSLTASTKTNKASSASLYSNQISTVTTCRLIGKARDTGLLKKMSYRDLMDDLISAWRMVNSPEPPKSDDGCWVHTLKSVFDELEALGPSTPVPTAEPKKQGRPKKEPAEPKPKRPRERPRKNS